MFRSFMRAPISISTPGPESTSQTSTSTLLRLPPHLLNLIFDELAVLDRCTLALTCRSLLTFASTNEHLDYLISSPPTVYHLEHFFQRLSRGWIPHPYLRYCPDCGKFVSLDPHHWRHISEKYTRESVGRIAGVWRLRREDGWLRYWIERWCMVLHGDRERGGSGSGSSGLAGSGTGMGGGAAALMFADDTERVCPRCAVVNPETNEFRLGRIRERNERYGEVRGRRIVSPGMNSPSVGGGDVSANGSRSGGSSGSIGGSEARIRSPLLERRQVAVAIRGGRMVQTPPARGIANAGDPGGGGGGRGRGGGGGGHGLGIQTTWI